MVLVTGKGRKGNCGAAWKYSEWQWRGVEVVGGQGTRDS